MTDQVQPDDETNEAADSDALAGAESDFNEEGSAAAALEAAIKAVSLEGGAGEPAPVFKLSAPAEPKYGYIWGTGRRKRSVARVRIRNGNGKFVVNGKDMKEFFCTHEARMTVVGPMEATETMGKYDVFVKVLGGGMTGQAGATALGLGRALKGAEPQLEISLREAGFLTRDSRMKERKKYGLRGARRAYQFSKR